MQQRYRRKRRISLRCTLCGREISAGEEFWACNGSRVCGDCLNAFAREELEPFRTIWGEEAER